MHVSAPPVPDHIHTCATVRACADTNVTVLLLQFCTLLHKQRMCDHRSCARCVSAPYGQSLVAYPDTAPQLPMHAIEDTCRPQF